MGNSMPAEYRGDRTQKRNTAGDRTQNRIPRGQDTKQNTAGDRTQNRIQQETGQRNGGNTRLSRTALKHNDKQRAK